MKRLERREKKKEAKLTKGKRGKLSLNEGPPSDELTYSGPVVVTPSEGLNQRTLVVTLSLNQVLNSSGAGVINTVIGNAPSSAVNWSDYLGAYDEYRTLAFSAQFTPTNWYAKSGSSPNTRMLLKVTDNDSGGALASYGAMCGYESVKAYSLEQTWTTTAKMSGVTQGAFTTTAVPAASQWIKFYADTLANSQEYGIFLLRWTVQFRGRN